MRLGGKRFWIAAFCWLATTFPARAWARRSWSLYRNERYHFQLVVPEGWFVSDARTHPSILLALLHPSGAQVRLAASVRKVRITLRAFAREEVQVVQKIGFAVGKLLSFRLGRLSGLWTRGTHPREPYSFRLYFFSRGRAFYVFTVTYPTKRYAEVLRDLRVILRSFTFTD